MKESILDCNMMLGRPAMEAANNNKDPERDSGSYGAGSAAFAAQVTGLVKGAGMHRERAREPRRQKREGTPTPPF
jgi:hypothetical protein